MQPMQGSNSSVTETVSLSPTVSLNTSTNLSLTVRNISILDVFSIELRTLSCKFLYSSALTRMVKLPISGLRLSTCKITIRMTRKNGYRPADLDMEELCAPDVTLGGDPVLLRADDLEGDV